MLGLFGGSVIGTDHLTGPVSDEEEKAARFVRHETVRGKPVLQDLGNDAGTRSFSFFFDEVFCNPTVELAKIELAFQARAPMKLFFDLRGFQINFWIIERLRIDRKKTSPSGRLVRVELEAELVETEANVQRLLGGAAQTLRSAINPALRRLR